MNRNLFTVSALCVWLLGMVGPVLAADTPNILFAIADDWGLHASAYGTRWVQTPAFDRVARAGILFNNAYTPNAKCAPSRACILTGRISWQLGAAANHISYLPPEFNGWGEALAGKGWFVGHTMKGWGPGVATNLNGKPRQMTGRAFNARKAKPPNSGISNNDYAGNFDDFVSFIDLAPTFIELAGLKWSQTSMAETSGRSLTETTLPAAPPRSRSAPP